MRLDRQPILPYDFTQRVRSLRATIEDVPTGPGPALLEELNGLTRTLDEFERQAEGLSPLLARTAASGSDREGDAINDRLRRAARP